MQPPTHAPDLLRAVGDLWMRIDGLSRIERLRRGIHVHSTHPRPALGQTPYQVVHVHDKLQLKHYPASVSSPAEGSEPVDMRPRPPVVLVPSLINRATILDLEPERSLVRGLSEKGHPVYLVDWGTPGPEDAQEDVGYVLESLLHRSIDRACRHAGHSQALLFGYCMGGTLAAMYTALHPDRVAGLSLLNAPFHFEKAGRFRDFVAHVDVDKAIAKDGLLPVSMMKPAFQLLDPVGAITKFFNIEKASRDPKRLRRTLARERWLEENLPLPGAFAQEFISKAYQQDLLFNGGWFIGQREIRLQDITCPVLVCSAERDFIAPAESAEALADLVPHARVERLDAGHIGVIVGAFGPRHFYPMLDTWMREVA
ncbi:MAG: alpha/beta fold hydrolase [Myxococcota bacterium]|nr:alpha/beta fold hydrolase [Myxococcota bacterium]